MQFEQRLQVQAQLESGIVEGTGQLIYRCKTFLILFLACSLEGLDALSQQWVAEATRFESQYLRCVDRLDMTAFQSIRMTHHQ